MAAFAVNVRDFGAAGDGQHNDFPAIQSALDAGAVRVVIPAGKYMLGDTLRVPSHTRLLLHENAEMIMGDGVGKTIDNFLITNQKGATDIVIDGGIWNGNNAGNHRVDYRNRELYHGVMIGFRHTEDLVLRNMTLRDSEGFHMRLNFVKRFLVENIVFDDISIRPNQDGVHIAGGCEDGVVRNITGAGASSPNDDMVAIISDIPDYYNDMDMGDMRGQEHGDIRRIRVEHLRARNTFSFLRILSCNHSIEDIEVRDVEGGFYYLAVQMQVEPLGRVHIGRSVLGTGHIRNVLLRDFNVYRNTRYQNEYFGAEFPPEPAVHIEQNVENLRLENFSQDLKRDSRPDRPMVYLDNCHENSVRWIGESTETLSVRDPISCAEIRRPESTGIPSRTAVPAHLSEMQLSGNEALYIAPGTFESLRIN